MWGGTDLLHFLELYDCTTFVTPCHVVFMLDVLRDGVLNPPRIPRIAESSIAESGSDIERVMFGDAMESDPLPAIEPMSLVVVGKFS